MNTNTKDNELIKVNTNIKRCSSEMLVTNNRGSLDKSRNSSFLLNNTNNNNNTNKDNKDKFISYDKKKSVADIVLEDVLINLNSKYKFSSNDKKFKLNSTELGKDEIKRLLKEDKATRLIEAKNPNFEDIVRKGKKMEQSDNVKSK